MTLLHRHILSLVLSLLVVLTGQAAAVAHGAPGPAGRMELCTGSGPVMVYVDADGQPVGDPVYCPEFALSLILALDLPDVTAGPVALKVVPQGYVVPVAGAARQALIERVARGPPARI